ncbi:hypothetical protein WMY93_026617 [Mugilogobius chulae]|uniref:Ig-like domain-containing protein n=1 Tax=Mugilogobius chulae TaxID=88201 RepID=A0AAW0MY17_9GOBI
MVDSSIGVRILSKAQISMCLDNNSLERLGRLRGLNPGRLKELRTCVLSVEVSKGEVKKRLAAAEKDLSTVSSRLVQMAMPRQARSASKSFAAMLQALNTAIDEMAADAEKIVQVILMDAQKPMSNHIQQTSRCREGQPITLTCSSPTSCSPDLEIESASLVHLFENTQVYTAQHLSHPHGDDGREFTCQTQGNEDKQLIKTTISVEWSSVTLTCSAKAHRPSLYLAQVRGNSFKHEGAILTIHSAQIEHNGEYVCTAKNEFGTGTSNVRIDVKFKPKNTYINSQTREVVVGGSVTFNCNSDANPLPHEYYWYRVGSANNFQTTITNSLELKSVQRTDKACYKCKAQNKLGPGDYSRDLCLEVLVPPTSLTLSMDTEVTEGQRVSITCRVDNAPQNVRVQADPGLTVKENTTVTLHCSAQSHPPVSSMTWSRGRTGQELSVHTGHTFSVRSVSVNDSDFYTCTAHNQVGKRTSAPAHLIVKFGPKQTVVLRAEEEQGPDGSRSVTLSCSSHSVPPVRSYTWYRRTEDRELKVSENINYTVLSTQPGVYYCTAKNEISERTSEPVSLFQGIKQRGRLKRKERNKSWWRSCSRPVGPWHSSRNLTEDAHGRPAASRDQNTQADPLFYASLHFDKTKRTMPSKEKEEVIYSTVKKHKKEVGDVYENIPTVQEATWSSTSDSSEEEVEVNYSTVNFKSKAQNGEQTRVTAAEEDYSILGL